jgi:hypothetical protein
MKEKIEIIISGGCVQQVINPTNCEVVIRDYDVETVDAEGNPNCEQDSDGDWYQNITFS